jgi:transposase
LYQRLQAVWLMAQGYGVPEISHITKSPRRSVYRWVQRYLHAHSIQDLQDTPRAGRPKTAPALTPQRILEALHSDPLAAGYTTTVWTVPLLARHLSQHLDCAVQAHTLRRRMKQIGLRWKRPRYGFTEKEPNRAQKKGRLYAV